MLGVKVKLTLTPKRVEKATDKGAYKSLRHAAFSIRKSAQESMVFQWGPSRPGSPPHAHTGRLRRSILVAQEKGKDEVVVGPSYSRVKFGGRPPWLAQMLEHGGTFRWRRKRKKRGGLTKREKAIRAAGYGPAMQSITFPARPFMQPALERNLARFHREWQGAI